jgi:hypothetical protein
MTAILARAVMSLAVRCFGESRRDWAKAMQAEFELAVSAGKPLGFASGCLAAAWGEMPRHPEGRQALANYVLALVVLIPMAVLPVAFAFGLSSALAPAEPSVGLLLAGASQENPVLAWPQLGAAPSLMTLWLLLGVAHLALAWRVVEQDWARAIKVGALIAATLATLLIVMAALALDLTFVTLTITAIAVELSAVAAAVRWQMRRLSHDSLEMAAR